MLSFVCRWENVVVIELIILNVFFSFKVVPQILFISRSKVCAWRCSFQILDSSSHLLFKMFPSCSHWPSLGWPPVVIQIKSDLLWLSSSSVMQPHCYTPMGWALLNVAWDICWVCITHTTAVLAFPQSHYISLNKLRNIEFIDNVLQHFCLYYSKHFISKMHTLQHVYIFYS